MIYFIRDEATQYIKIGFTAGDSEDRLSDLQTGCPGRLVLLLEMEGSKQLETAWHERFAGARERGEWFRPVPELLQAIDDVKASIEEKASEENVRRILQKLQREQEEFEKSGASALSAEDIQYLLVLQREEERQRLTARVGKVRKLVDALDPAVSFRKLHAVLNALEMQVDDGKYQCHAVARLCNALLATAELYDIPEFLAKELKEAVCFVKRDIQDA